MKIPDWVPVLRLSTMWGFNAIRVRAIAKLSKVLALQPFSRLTLSERFDIEEWKIPAMEQIVQRNQPLSVSEIQQLDPVALCAIMSVREGWLVQGSNANNARSAYTLSGSVQEELQKLLDENSQKLST